MSSPAEIAFYCPSCAAPAAAGTTFCKSCGADIRYVPRAMRGGLTPRQRRFVNALMSMPGYVVVTALMASMAPSTFPVVLGALCALGLVGTAGYAGYLLIRDGSSTDPIFRLSQPTASAPPAITAPPATGETKRVGGTTADETPTKRF